jgi:hypothetical protein
MLSQRNRLAITGSSISPDRSRKSQAIWMEFSISTDVECSAMIAKRSEAASVSGLLCDIAGMDAGTTVLAPGLRTEGAAMSNEDHKPMAEDQARDSR